MGMCARVGLETRGSVTIVNVMAATLTSRKNNDSDDGSNLPKEKDKRFVVFHRSRRCCRRL